MTAYIALSGAIAIGAFLALLVCGAITNAARQTSVGTMRWRIAQQFTPLGWTLMAASALEAAILFLTAWRGGAL